MAKSKPEAPAGVFGPEAFNSFSAALTDAGERSRAAMQAGFEQWSSEAAKFYTDMSAQGVAALDQLRTCKSPLEVLNVERAWIAACSKAYLDIGSRYARAFTQSLRSNGAAPRPGA